MQTNAHVSECVCSVGICKKDTPHSVLHLKHQPTGSRTSTNTHLKPRKIIIDMRRASRERAYPFTYSSLMNWRNCSVSLLFLFFFNSSRLNAAGRTYLEVNVVDTVGVIGPGLIAHRMSVPGAVLLAAKKIILTVSFSKKGFVVGMEGGGGWCSKQSSWQWKVSWQSFPPWVIWAQLVFKVKHTLHFEVCFSG